ncbi:hypothetical protein G3I32_34450 [Streptomyces coelicoflavus]|uniref:Uncharacterized protein n=1 Tax=Streptomyces coelicoflavus TaxID=285562 RepID=A0A7K3PVA2_9ACTN|nr:hypothetical protein [Streptomyces coelicoflavus]NEB13880.1 hypothetical protein [Streptomyces coelicoflavus]
MRHRDAPLKSAAPAGSTGARPRRRAHHRQGEHWREHWREHWQARLIDTTGLHTLLRAD